MKATLPGTASAGDSGPKHVIIGTAGHIDHGKTALVYALTGTDTDRLPEEKQRGITIDLGFASVELEHPSHGRVDVSLIDVPGHHAFVRNMLAGTGGIDCVMLVIAADEGVGAQTEEHLAICGLLGIKRGLVALSKADAVTEEHLRETRERVRRFLQHTFLDGAPMLAVSALRGDGISQLKAALAELAAQVPARSTEHLVRLPVDRAFSIRGFGTIVTGTLQAGSLHAGESLEQYPARRLLRVRGLQVHGNNADAANAPCRVALNLAGIEVAQVARGDTLVVPDTLAVAATVDVEVSMLPGAPALKHGAKVRVHAFTSDTLAKVLFFDRQQSSDAEPAFARLRLAKPLLSIPGDRIVLRRCSPAMTIGGAVVLDAAPLPGLRKVKVLEWLQALKPADSSEQLRLRVARRGAEGISLDALIAETGLTAEAVRSRLASQVSGGQLLSCGPNHESATHWMEEGALAEAVRIAERELTAAGTLSRAELRSRGRLNAAVFPLILGRIIGSGRFELAGDALRAAGRGDRVSEPMLRQMQAVEEVYANAGLATPLLSEVEKMIGVSSAAMRELITFLLRSKRLVRMGSDDAFVHADVLARFCADLRRHRGETFDVGRFKALTGLTRKHAIPLLEHLDQARVTRNNGGIRTVL